jgi:hypothetical protein
VPYVLLGILTLGTWLAIGLGLSEGPITYNASSFAEVTGTPCSAASDGGRMTCHLSSGEVVIWFGQYARGPIPPGAVDCVVEGLDGVGAASRTEAEAPAGVLAAINVLLPGCERGTGGG